MIKMKESSISCKKQKLFLWTTIISYVYTSNNFKCNVESVEKII